MAQRQPRLNNPGIMNRNNQPVTILSDVEDHKSIHMIGVRKTLAQFRKASPAGRSHNPNPGTDLMRGLPVFLRRLL